MKLRQRPALKWIRISESAVGILYVLTQAAGQGHIYLPWTELEQGVTALLLIDIRDMERHIMDMAIDKKNCCP